MSFSSVGPSMSSLTSAAAKSLQSCPTLCDPRDGTTRLPRPWDSPGKNTGVCCHFLLQCMKVKSESEVAQSCPTLSDPLNAAYQAPPSMGFSRQEYWSGVPLPSPQVALVVKNSPANAGDTGDAGWIPESGRSPGGANSSPLQCSCLENPMDRGAWWAMVHGVAKSQND